MSSASSGQLAEFLTDLIKVLDQAVGVENLFDGGLGVEMQNAWASVKDGLEGSLEDLADLSEDDLRRVGLAGAQLNFKISVWKLLRDQWRSDLEAGSWDKLKGVSSKLLRLANTILGSLLAIGALPGMEALRELVGTLESLI